MCENKRLNIMDILENPSLRRKLMVWVIQATQAREGIDTSQEQAEHAYDKVQAERLIKEKRNTKNWMASLSSK